MLRAASYGRVRRTVTGIRRSWPSSWRGRVLGLVLLPVLAVISVGFLVRAFVDAGGNHWLLLVLVLAFSCGAWFYVFTTEAP
jgi:hypothetical protein